MGDPCKTALADLKAELDWFIRVNRCHEGSLQLSQD
jgi:hypothetical protein